MTKESYNLIGQMHISDDNFKFCELCCGKNFWRNQLIFHSELFWSSHSPRWSKGTCSKPRQVCEWLGKPGHTKPKAVVTELQSKKWYSCIPHRYWWSKNPAIWLDENILFYNLQSRTLSDMGFAQKNIEL